MYLSIYIYLSVFQNLVFSFTIFIYPFLIYFLFSLSSSSSSSLSMSNIVVRDIFNPVDPEDY